MKTIEEIREIISTLTLEEKASLCSGETFWLTKKIPGKDIPVIVIIIGISSRQISRIVDLT